MKNITLPILLFLSIAAQSEQKISFIDNDWNKARTEVQQKNKYLFVDAYTDWCYWCKIMDKQTFSDSEAVQFMNQNFVTLKLEMEHNYGINVAMKYRVSAFPSFLVFNAEGKLVRKLMGFFKVKEFLEEMKNTLNATAYPPFFGISEKVDLDFPDFYKKSFDGRSKKDPITNEEVNDFLDKQNDLFTEVNYSVMVRFASRLFEKNQNFLLNNRQKYESLYGKEEIKDAVSNIGYGLLTKAIKSKSETDLQAALNFTDKHNSEKADDTKNYYLISFYKATENWNFLAKEADNYIAKHGAVGGLINDWAWTIYEKCEDKEIIAKAIEWMKPVIEEKPEYASMDTYAALFYKAGKLNEAKTYARKAIELGKAAGEDTDITQKLLKKIESGK